MRLLRTNIVDGELQIVSFDNPKDTPRYVILSHTWVNGQEVLFHHIISRDPTAQALTGYQKVYGCCQQALKDGYEYVWIDTCCIDKTSSAELSEAINSMFLWYQGAAICYAFLSDLPTWIDASPDDLYKFQSLKWFTRGWTLQELIAPSVVRFYAADWTLVGDKTDLAETIENVTGIDQAVLHGAPFANSSIAMRMSWASDRQTTRVEDRAYSLMGLFGVNMPVIYGEGEQAFIRLQHEIMALSAAHSLLAWNAYRRNNSGDDATDLLASSPDCFEPRSQYTGSVHIVDIPHRDFFRVWDVQDAAAGLHKELNGIRAVLPVFEVPEKHSAYYKSRIDAIAVLACKITDRDTRQYWYGLPLRRSGPPMSNHYVKAKPFDDIVNVDSLINMDIPCAVRSLFLATDTIPRPEESSSALSRPETFQFKVSVDNLEILRDISDLVFVPHSDGSHTAYPKFDPKLEIPPSEYEEDEEGYLIFEASNVLDSGNDDGACITFAYLTQPGDMQQYQPVTIALYAYTETNVAGLALLCWHAGVGPQTDIGISVGVPYFVAPEEAAVCHKLQCECGLSIEVGFVQIDPLKPQSCAFMLDIKLRSHPVAAVVQGLTSKQVMVPQVPLAYRPRRSPQWVEGTAGFSPPDAILFTSLDINRLPYIVRVSDKEDPTEDPDATFGTRLTRRTQSKPAMFRKRGTLVNTMTYATYLKQNEEPSINYDILAGPANSVRWIQCHNNFDVGALGGASPIPAGHDIDGAPLCFARGWESHHKEVYLGIVKEGSCAHFDFCGVDTWKDDWYDEERTDYEVLVYA